MRTRSNKRQRQSIYMMLTAGEHPRQIAQSVGMSERQIWRLKRNFDTTGKLYPQSNSKYNAIILTPAVMEEVLELLRHKPDLYLDEIQYYLATEMDIHVSTSAISKQLKASEWTNKRMAHKASQRSEPLRLDWLRKVSTFSAEMYVFCDESGVDKRDGARRTGWAPKGMAPVAESALTRGKRFHLLPAITVDGLIDVLCYKGATDTTGFIAWLEEEVLPKMNPFPGRYSILVMDNASWHKDPAIKTACDNRGVLLWFLPPYSPDFNPIEAYFSDVKACIRRQYQHAGGDTLSNEEFKAFLEGVAREVGQRVDAIRGHYRQANVPFRDDVDNREKDYVALYGDQLHELTTTGTVA